MPKVEHPQTDELADFLGDRLKLVIGKVQPFQPNVLPDRPWNFAEALIV
jgi:hypothetical protein